MSTDGSVNNSELLRGAVYAYRYIDHGAQYRIYAVHTMDGAETGRVVKVPLDFVESRQALAPHLKKLAFTESEIDHRIHTLILRKQELPRLLQGIFANDKALMRMTGDLRLIPVLVNVPQSSPEYTMPVYFTQKQVTPMADFMHRFRFVDSASSRLSLSDVKQARHLIRAIIQLHYHLWEYGVFELTFKLENVGITPSGRSSMHATLVDMAEHTLDIGLAKTTLAEQKWHHWCNPIKTDHLFLPLVLHHEYMRMCDQMLTPEALERHWRKRSDAITRRASRTLRIQQMLKHNSEKELALWVKRQTLRTVLYRGIPEHRIDTMMIPRADLELLYKDTHTNKAPASRTELQAEAERAMAQQYGDGTTQEIFRHSMPITSR
ncbi:MAG: hypothetical protein ACQR33_03045 [Candidatus Saccharibacteria bacterium]